MEILIILLIVVGLYFIINRFIPSWQAAKLAKDAPESAQHIDQYIKEFKLTPRQENRITAISFWMIIQQHKNNLPSRIKVKLLGIMRDILSNKLNNWDQIETEISKDPELESYWK